MKKILLVFGLFALAATLVACGGSDDTKEPLVHSQGVSDTEIIVGNTAVNDGPLGFVGAPFLAGMEAYFTMVNEAGGVFGRNIRLVHYSDGFDGETGLTHTQTLVEVDKVFAMVGHFGTPTVGATAEYLETWGIPRVYYGTGTTLVYEEDAEGSASFPVQPVYEYEGEMMAARSIDSFNAKKIGLIYTANENGFEIKAGLERVAQAQGVEVVSAQVSGTDYASAALTIINADVDVIVLGMNQWNVVSALLELYANGNTKPAIMSYVAADASVLAQVKQVAAGFEVYANAWVNTIDDEGAITPEFALYQAEIVKEYPAYENNSFAIAGWIAAMVFVKGLERMDENEPITWENFVEAMESSVFNYGLGSPIDFTNGKRVGTQIMSFLQMKLEGEVGYFEIAEQMESVAQILARQE